MSRHIWFNFIKLYSLDYNLIYDYNQKHYEIGSELSPENYLQLNVLSDID